MTFGRSLSDRASSGSSPADLDTPYGGSRADGFGGYDRASDGFGRSPLRAGRGDAGAAGGGAVARSSTDGLGGALLRSAATDLEQIRSRVGPAARLLPGYQLGAAGLARELQAIVRRVDEAMSAGAATVRGAEIENLAGAVRALTLDLPPHLRDAPEVQDAMATLTAALGDVAGAAGARTSAEPTSALAALGDAEQARLARVLIADATATLEGVDALPPGAGEHAEYARAASSAASQVRVAADLVAAHVPPGKARMALDGVVDGLSRRIARVDQWVRAAKLSSDPSIALLFRHEAQLRELVGLEAAHRSPLETLDPETTATGLSTVPAHAEHTGTVAAVREAFRSIIEGLERAVGQFEEGADKKDPPRPSLSDLLVVKAVETALDRSLHGAFKHALLTGVKSLAGLDEGGWLTEFVTNTLWSHGHAELARVGQRAPQKRADLLQQYVTTLRDGQDGINTGLRLGFEAQADRLAKVTPASLAALSQVLIERAHAIRAEATVQHVLAWQTLKTRNDEGPLQEPAPDGPDGRSKPSARDADLTPGFTAGVPGVLHVDFPIVRLAPRASRLRESSVRIEGLAAAHRAALRDATPRPLRELRLNTSIRVTSGDVDLGGVEILWFPDSDAVHAGWERTDRGGRSLAEARHLIAYARGLPVDHTDLDHGTEAEAHEAARLIAEAVGSTSAEGLFR